MIKITYQFIIITLIIIGLHLYLYKSQHIEKSDHAFYDYAARLLHNTQTTSQTNTYTVVVEIDEKSLKTLGQWPWPRVIDANLIDKIREKNPSAIGLDILFPESDRVSPLSIQEFYKKYFNLNIPLDEIPTQFQDNDKLLGESIKNANTTLSIYLNNSSLTEPHCKELTYKKYNSNRFTLESQAKSVLCNEKKIQTSTHNFGFINASNDTDGILRRMPLLLRYQQEVYPSFALATILSFDQNFKIKYHDETILINFWQKEPKVFSAIDVLRGEVPTSELQGKIVIVGSSVFGLTPFAIAATHQSISNSMVQALTIESLLNHTYLIQPKTYKQVNILLSLLLSITIVLFFRRKLYLMITLLMTMAATISLIWLLHAYTQGTYISIGYLWTPLFYVSILIGAFHLRTLSKERQEQEKFLIKQSKLASMGEMISLIAHQWRQPLSAINGTVLNIDMDYRKDLLNDKKLEIHLNKIEETTTYLSKTISDFNNFFSNEKHQEEFYMSDVVVQARTLTSYNNNDQVTIVYRQKENIKIIGYKSELLQSILILLNNAIYACEKNLPNTHQGHILIDTYEKDDTVVITIEDNGGGVNTQDLHKIFNPYFTTKAKPHGTGLGLYILKLIVEDSMNGKVSVHNSKIGAVFTIEIPKKINKKDTTRKKNTTRKEDDVIITN